MFLRIDQIIDVFRDYSRTEWKQRELRKNKGWADSGVQHNPDVGPVSPLPLTIHGKLEQQLSQQLSMVSVASMF